MYMYILGYFFSCVNLIIVAVHAELVYTIGDEISFISFMTDLRRKLAEHPDSEDILGGHKDPNLSETGDHPVLAKQRADEQPARWIHVTLQAVEGEETSWTTLFMRDDNVYVLGFMNQQGDSFQLLDDNRNASTNMVLPITNGRDPELSRWGVSYMSMLGAKSNDHAVHKLEAAHLGRDFAKNAVRVLSSYPNLVAGPSEAQGGTGGPDRHGLRVRKDESSPRLLFTWVEHRHGIRQAIDD